MAIGSGDGSIVLKTKVDNTGLSNGLKGIKGNVKSVSSAFSGLGATIAAAFSIRAISNFLKKSQELYKVQMQNEVKLATVMRQRMNATDEEIKSMLDLASAQQQVGIIGDEVQLAGLQQIATFAKHKESIESLLPAMNNLVAQQYGYEASAESARNVANLMGKALLGQTGALTRVGITFDATEEKMLKTGNEMERAAALAQIITNNVGEMNTALAQTDTGRQKQLANTLGDIKEQFGAAYTQLAILFIPALQVLASLLSKVSQIARAAAQKIASIFGKEVTTGTEKTNENISTSVEGMEDLTEETKKAGKAAKKSLASFDELNTLTSTSSSSTSDTETDTSTDTSGTTGTGFDFGIQANVDEIDSTLSFIMGIVGEALIAVGILLLFFGQIGWGIGFIIVGAVVFGISVASASEFGADGVVNMLTTIMGIAGGALLAIGIILLWIGGVVGKGVAIGMIIAGAVLIVSAVATKAAFSPKDVKGWLSLILGVAAGALLALGIILCMVGSVPLGVGLIIAGVVSLVSAFAINSNTIVSAIQGPLGTILMLVSGVLLVIGIILVCTGAALPLAIGLIAVGAVGLASTIALNWNTIPEKISKFFKDNAGLIVGISLAILVLGIVLCLCGIVTPLSIGLIVFGATGLVATVALNWEKIKTSISNFIKNNSALIVGVSLALLVLGIILLFTGVGIPLAIGLIVVGAAGLVATVALNWSYISQKITSFFRENAGLITGVSLALLVLGIILLFTGVGIPLAIGLIVAGGGMLAATVALNWNFIVDKVKEVWKKVKTFWNTYIAPIFTGTWWANLGKKAINGLLGVIETGLNWIIDKINTFIGGLSSVTATIGSVIGVDWSIPSIPRVSIPRLAKGAVIPGGREFMAILGDQPKGQTNIEAPADLIKQMVNEALNERGFDSNQQINIIAKGDVDSIISLFKFEIEKQDRLAGVTI